MSEFSKEDYLAGMDDADRLASSGGPVPSGRDGDTPSADADPAQAPSSDSGEGNSTQGQDGSPHADESRNSKDSDTLTPLGQAKKEAADYLEALQRERAEFINFRNRAQKEQDRYRQHGIIDVLTALLPALDDIDRIRTHGEMDDSFKAVAAKIDSTFAKFGVEKYGAAGEDFDPSRYDAVLRKPDAGADHEVIDTVVEAGYRINDRIIRAARAVVAVPAEDNPETDTGTGSGSAGSDRAD
ncbi:nucleotide exchange factor GrpE [Scardovia wiggsiae]|uniref:nucleotide exchange factor GrpE n=1 Tax=Scardovia wiggsiae TaxID=230143 RepID=UPI003610650A